MRISAKMFVGLSGVVGILTTICAFAQLTPVPFPKTINDYSLQERIDNKREGYEPFKNLQAYDVPAFNPNDDGFYSEVLKREGKETLCRVHPTAKECMPRITYNPKGGSVTQDCTDSYTRTVTTAVQCSAKRERSNFLGWSRSATDCSNPEFAPLIGPKEVQDVIFYACYKCNQGTIDTGDSCACSDSAMDDNCRCTGSHLKLSADGQQCECIDRLRENAYVDRVAKQCVCQDPTMDPAKDCLAPLECSDPEHMDRMCNCDAGMHLFGSKCHCAYQDSNYNWIKNPRQDRDNQCACLDSDTMDSNNNCECRGDMQWDGSACKCTGKNTKFNASANKCECTDPSHMTETCECMDSNKAPDANGKCVDKGQATPQTDGKTYALMQCRTNSVYTNNTSTTTSNPFKTLGCETGTSSRINDCFTRCVVKIANKRSSAPIPTDKAGYINEKLDDILSFCAGTSYDVSNGRSEAIGFFSRVATNYESIKTLTFSNLEVEKIKKALESVPKNNSYCDKSDLWVIYVLEKQQNEWLPVDVIKIHEK